MRDKRKIEVYRNDEENCWQANFCDNDDCLGRGATPGQAVDGLYRIFRDREIYKIQHPVSVQ